MQRNHKYLAQPGVSVSRNTEQMATTQETGWAGFFQQSKQEHFSLESQVAACAALNQYSAQLSACEGHLSGLGGSALPPQALSSSSEVQTEVPLSLRPCPLRMSFLLPNSYYVFSSGLSLCFVFIAS